jgi:hypothetical protein
MKIRARQCAPPTSAKRPRSAVRSPKVIHSVDVDRRTDCAGCVALAVAARLLVRRYQPDDTLFAQPARAANTLMAVATLTGVMLAFVVFFALGSFQRAREGASVEAIAVNEMNTSAAVLGGETGTRLHGELVCYARAVVDDEWPAMAKRSSSDSSKRSLSHSSPRWRPRE